MVEKVKDFLVANWKWLVAVAAIVVVVNWFM